MKGETPICRSGPKWIRTRLEDRSALAPLTGQDARALHAFLHLTELYAIADGPGRTAALDAMRATLRAMQPSCVHLAKAAIPHALDWGDEEPIWARVKP